MSNPADDIVDDVVTRAQERLEELGADIEAELKEQVSVPVGRSKGKVERSKPGESPRRDRGDYYKSFGHAVTSDGDRVAAHAGTDMERGQWLEGGTGRMAPRPHFGVVFRRLLSGISDRFVKLLSQN